MRACGSVVAALVASLVFADVSVAQPPPPPYGGPGRPPGQFSPPRGPQGSFQHYYNGRWVGQDEWQRRGVPERDRWARNYRRRGHDENTTSALLGGIIGFALGAAIVGSAQQAEQARTADASWDAHCRSKYRSYDPSSRTYLGADGVRHYCQ